MSFKRAALYVYMLKFSGCVEQQVVKKWLFLLFLGVASFRRICPGCRIKSQRAVCSGSLSLFPRWACCGGDNCNVFLWPRKVSNYHCKGPHRKGCGRSHFVSWAPLSSCCGTINTLSLSTPPTGLQHPYGRGAPTLNLPLPLLLLFSDLSYLLFTLEEINISLDLRLYKNTVSWPFWQRRKTGNNWISASRGAK